MKARKRKLQTGLLKGKLTVPEGFDAPLPENVMEGFYGTHNEDPERVEPDRKKPKD